MTGSWQKFPLCLNQVNLMIQITIDQYQSYQLYPVFEKLIYRTYSPISNFFTNPH